MLELKKASRSVITLFAFEPEAPRRRAERLSQLGFK
jgi:hypothetical protein